MKRWTTTLLFAVVGGCAAPGASAPAVVRTPPPVPSFRAPHVELKDPSALTPSLQEMEQAGEVLDDEDNGLPWRKFSLSIGGMLVGMNSDVRFGTTGAGVSVNLEDALGLDTSQTVLRTEGTWRLSESMRHRLDLSYIRLNRTSRTTVGEDIDIGDGTIGAGSEVATELDFQLIRAAYSYSLIFDERVDLAVSGGLFVAPISASVQAADLSVDEDFSITAPLPALGARADVALTERQFLRTQFELFYLEFGDYRGVLQNSLLAYEFRPWDFLGIGVGLDTFGASVEAKGDTVVPGVNSNGKIDFDYAGLLIYVRGFL